MGGHGGAQARAEEGRRMLSNDKNGWRMLRQGQRKADGGLATRETKNRRGLQHLHREAVPNVCAMSREVHRVALATVTGGDAGGGPTGTHLHQREEGGDTDSEEDERRQEEVGWRRHGPL